MWTDGLDTLQGWPEGWSAPIPAPRTHSCLTGPTRPPMPDNDDLRRNPPVGCPCLSPTGISRVQIKRGSS